jgi:uncharacterized protein
LEFNVAGLLKEHTGEKREYEVDEQEVNLGDSSEATGVRGKVRLTRTPDGILAAATLSLRVGEQCARCLRTFSEPLQVEIEEVYYPTIDIENGHRLPAQDDPEAFLIDEHHILDLSEPLRQYRWMAEHLAPLCRADCKGLCPTCGIDLNDQAEHNHEPPVDTRWSALAGLAGRLTEEN